MTSHLLYTHIKNRLICPPQIKVICHKKVPSQAFCGPLTAVT